ncbi:MAG: nuclear transport factor 2 family protein [Bacillota bacterium]
MRFYLLGLSLAATVLAAPANAATGDEQTLLTLEQRWLTAGEQRDIPALKEILVDDFLHTTYLGTLRDKADHLKSTLAPAKSRQTLDDLKVRLYGDTGIVTGENVITAQDGSYVYKLRFTDVFVKRGGRWQAVSAQETPEKMP